MKGLKMPSKGGPWRTLCTYWTI